MASGYTICVQVGCDNLIRDPKDKHVLCKIHRPCDAQCPCEFCDPDDVSSILTRLSRRDKSVVSKLGPGHLIKDIEGPNKPLTNKNPEPGRLIKDIEGSGKKRERSREPKPRHGHRSKQGKHARSSPSRSSQSSRGNRSQTKSSKGAKETNALEKTSGVSSSKESPTEANLRLTAQVESYRQELEEMKATLAQFKQPYVPSVHPSIGVRTGEDEFTEGTQQRRQRDEIGAEDSASQVHSQRAGESTPFDVARYLSAPEKKSDQEAPKFGELLSFLTNYLELKRKVVKPDSAEHYQNLNERMLESANQSADCEVTSLPPSDTVTHWVNRCNMFIRGSNVPEELAQYTLSAHPEALGSEKIIVNDTSTKIFPGRAYKVHNYEASPRPLTLDPDHELLGNKEGSVTFNKAAIQNLEGFLRSSLGVISFMDHSAVAITKLLQEIYRDYQLTPEIQMVLNLLKSNARALNHVTGINTAALSNVVLQRRDSFLAGSTVASDSQLRSYLRNTSTRHTTLFANQIAPVAKAVSERKRPADKSGFRRPSAPPAAKVRKVASPKVRPSQPSRQSYSQREDYRPYESYRGNRGGRGRPNYRSGRGRGARGQNSKNF